jgi:DNA adenine methylase Dam
MNMVRSPLNYTGGKFRLLPQLTKAFPTEVDTFYDAFTGGGTVAANVIAKHVVATDIQQDVIALLRWMALTKGEIVLKQCDKIISEFGLSRSDLLGYECYNATSGDGLGAFNRAAYCRLRATYGINGQPRDPARFLVLIAYAFNNQIRFGKHGGYNIPVGKRDMNKAMRDRLLNFCQALKTKSVQFKCASYQDLEIKDMKPGDFIYADPPYLISTASYNEGGGWGVEHEKNLLEWLVRANTHGIRFALSNVMEHKNQTNILLKNWCVEHKWNVIEMSACYNNSSYQAKREGKTREVLITNYN